MIDGKVGLLGATSLVGQGVISQLREDGVQIHAFSRRPLASGTDDLIWHRLPIPYTGGCDRIERWLCAAPVWVLPEHFELLESYGARRVVVLSSTSRFTKTASPDKAERAVADRLIEGEESLKTWATSRAVEWGILRPTLMYGLGRDKNIAEIAGVIRRFGFFPLLGKANGLRQPVHVEDVAKACVAALESAAAVNRVYNLSGGEILSYAEMVRRVFAALHRPPRLLTIPSAVFSIAVACLRLLPRYRHWSAAMAGRMNRDLVFDHSDAARDLRFSPRPFQLSAEELPG